VLFAHLRVVVSRDMSWTDQHQVEEAADDDQVLSEEFDDWVREGTAPGEEDELEADQTDITADGADSTAEASREGEPGRGSIDEFRYCLEAVLFLLRNTIRSG